MRNYKIDYYPDLEKNYNPNGLRNALESYLAKCESNYKSPYNSGWDDLHWEKEIKETKAKLKIVGKQLKFDFPEKV